MSIDAPARRRTPPDVAGRLPPPVYAPAAGTSLMLTTEFVAAGILPDIAVHWASPWRAGSLITVFAVAMIVGRPLMTAFTMRVSPRHRLVVALVVFAGGHAVVAITTDVTAIMAACFVTALATGAF